MLNYLEVRRHNRYRRLRSCIHGIYMAREPARVGVEYAHRRLLRPCSSLPVRYSACKDPPSTADYEKALCHSEASTRAARSDQQQLEEPKESPVVAPNPTSGHAGNIRGFMQICFVFDARSVSALRIRCIKSPLQRHGHPIRSASARLRRSLRCKHLPATASLGSDGGRVVSLRTSDR